MKQTVNFYTFRDAFRAIRPDNFSAEGLSVLFDDLVQYEKDCEQSLKNTTTGWPMILQNLKD